MENFDLKYSGELTEDCLKDFGVDPKDCARILDALQDQSIRTKRALLNLNNENLVQRCTDNTNGSKIWMAIKEQVGIVPFESILSVKDTLQFAPTPEFETAVNHLFSLLNRHHLQSDDDDEIVVPAVLGSKGSGKSRLCIEACLEVARRYQVEHTVQPIVLRLRLPNKTLADIMRHHVDDLDFLANVLFAANNYNPDGFRVWASVQSLLRQQFGNPVPPILLHVDEIHLDPTLTSRIVQACLRLFENPDNMYHHHPNVTLAMTAQAGHHERRPPFLVVPILSGMSTFARNPIFQLEEITEISLSKLPGETLVHSFAQYVGTDAETVKKYPGFRRMFLFCASVPYAVDQLAKVIVRHPSTARVRFGGSSEDFYGVYEETLRGISKKLGEEQWRELLEVDERFPLDKPHPSKRLRPQEFLRMFPFGEPRSASAWKIMELIFYQVALGIVIENLDDTIAPTTGVECVFPTFSECIRAGVVRARRVDNGYVLEMSLMELMAINTAVHVLFLSLANPFSVWRDDYAYACVTAMYLRLKYAQLCGITEMPLEDLRPGAVFCVKGDMTALKDVKIIVPATNDLHMMKLYHVIRGDRGNPRSVVEEGEPKISIVPGLFARTRPKNKAIDHICILEAIIKEKRVLLVFSGRAKQRCTINRFTGLDSDPKLYQSEIKNILENMEQVAKLFVEEVNLTCNGTRSVEYIYEIVSDRKEPIHATKGFDKLPRLPLVLTRRGQFETVLGPMCSIAATQKMRDVADELTGDDFENRPLF